MSWNPALEPGSPDDVGMDAIETVIVPRSRDLGGFEVRRALPAPKRQMVGPFIFFDQAGPAELLTGQGIDVRPHPHIGLGTVTYLYRGDFHHRDSTGADQVIRPGALNWMVAGRGVTHSERTSEAARRPERSRRNPDLARPAGLARGCGAQFRASRRGDAADDRGSRRVRPADPRQRLRPDRARDHAFGNLLRRCDARTRTPPADAGRPRGPGHLHRRGLDLGRGAGFRRGSDDGLPSGRQDHGRGRRPGRSADDPRRRDLSGPRYIWWNFVASSRERIEAAKEEWRAANWGKGRFDLPADDRAEHIPLPD